MPPDGHVAFKAMVRLFRHRSVALGMAATAAAFMGQFALSSYVRPFLERVTGLDINAISLVLLGRGRSGLRAQ